MNGGQTIKKYATGMVRPKTTALFFDKLWVHPVLMDPELEISGLSFAWVPKEVCIENPMLAEEYFLAYGANVGWFAWDKGKAPDGGDDLIDNITFSGNPNHVASQTDFDRDPRRVKRFRRDHDEQLDASRETSTRYRNQVIRQISQAYSAKGIDLMPIYLDPTEYNKTIPNDAKGQGFEICLDFVPVILERELMWDQVIELREDIETKEKLDRLRRWFDIDLLTKSKEEVQAHIGKRLDDYEWALKKHGIQTCLGGITSVLSFVGGPTAIGLTAAAPLAAVAGGLLIGSGVLAWTAKRIIERQEIARSEVAYIYEVRKLGKSNRGK